MDQIVCGPDAYKKSKPSNRIGPRRAVKELKNIMENNKCYKIVKVALTFGMGMGVVAQRGMSYVLINPKRLQLRRTKMAKRKILKLKPWQLFQMQEAKRALGAVKRAIQYGIACNVVIRQGRYYRLIKLKPQLKLPLKKPEPLTVRKGKCLNIDKIYNRKKSEKNAYTGSTTEPIQDGDEQQ